MGESIAGGCRCGAVRYTVRIAGPPKIYCCHCRHCQTWSGSAFTEQALVPLAAIGAEGGVSEFALTREDGSVSTQFICTACHTRLWNVSSRWPALAALRAGTLDTAEILAPRLHIWTRRKQPWIGLDPDVPAFEENAPPAEMMKLFNPQTASTGRD